MRGDAQDVEVSIQVKDYLVEVLLSRRTTLLSRSTST